MKVGDVVLLDASITQEEFDVALMDERGELIRLDGVIRQMRPHMCRITMRRLLKPAKFLAPEEHVISRWVRTEQVIDVLDCEATLWPMLTGIREAAARRDGVKVPPRPAVHWTVGEPIPTE